jgi:ubiquinone/menaquinone biosynthesis C-methylase UbiE
MKMSAVEKLFVNSNRHSQRVATAMLERLQEVPNQPGQRLLEVGCGTGAAARAVAKTLRLDVTAVDVDPGQIALAQNVPAEDATVHWEVADATALPFADGIFDVVVTSKTLHHIDDWRRAVSESIRVLKPGGHFVVADIALPAWVARLGGRLASWHPTTATAEELSEFVRARGLKVVRQSRSLMTVTAVWDRPQ